ncbi:hypothetical protein NDU88_004943 [Pleurodeles waltl]|uniref:Uncharacterized protein n=1 Tax=Pleurodeles waltl TaxID=8319 RepID=A0AAV7TB51_PLEWA|nr:hypothetical protein NDU88_004943 [Pleurodeles waltl]
MLLVVSTACVLFSPALWCPFTSPGLFHRLVIRTLTLHSPVRPQSVLHPTLGAPSSLCTSLRSLQPTDYQPWFQADASPTRGSLQRAPRLPGLPLSVSECPRGTLPLLQEHWSLGCPSGSSSTPRVSSWAGRAPSPTQSGACLPPLMLCRRSRSRSRSVPDRASGRCRSAADRPPAPDGSAGRKFAAPRRTQSEPRDPSRRSAPQGAPSPPRISGVAGRTPFTPPPEACYRLPFRFRSGRRSPWARGGSLRNSSTWLQPGE